MPIYEFECNTCGHIDAHYYPRPNDTTLVECNECGETSERIYSLCNAKIFDVFTTTNILPGGVPVTVRGPGQLAQLENEHKVKMADGPPPQTRFSEPS